MEGLFTIFFCWWPLFHENPWIKKKIEFNHVLIGDVWLASGQSNMEHPISGWEWIPHSEILNAEAELEDSDYPEIRLFNVPLYPSPEPLENLPGGKWEMAGKKSLGQFSASAWFFAKKLHQELEIPIGIIHSSWGGTSILTWASGNILDDFKDSLNLREFKQIYDPKTWGDKVKASIANNRERRNKMSYPDPDIKNQLLGLQFSKEGWKEVDILDEEQDYGYVVWMKKEVELNQDQSGKDLVLSLGFLNRQSHIYWNSKELGYFQYPAPVKVKIPAGWAKEGINEITVRLSSQWGRATIHGSPDIFDLKDQGSGKAIALNEGWKVKGNLETIPPAHPFYVNQPTFLFNGMVAPIIPYGLKGFIWDQGSSDAGRPKLYAQLFQRLISDWRKYWQDDGLPFLFVQNTGTYTSHKFDKRTFARSYLREAQEKALELPETGMVVSIDIGDPYDVHPKNKQEFGRRLALQALKKVYGKEVVADGPFYGSHEIKGDTVVIRVKEPLQELVLRGNGGFELADLSGDYFPARSALKGNEIHVFSEKVSDPSDIRYAWGENPNLSVFNSEDLPMAPFRIKLKE